MDHFFPPPMVIYPRRPLHRPSPPKYEPEKELERLRFIQRCRWSRYPSFPPLLKKSSIDGADAKRDHDFFPPSNDLFPRDDRFIVSLSRDEARERACLCRTVYRKIVVLFRALLLLP
jgi:hypothetical protein